jgi:WD40 repeat protein
MCARLEFVVAFGLTLFLDSAAPSAPPRTDLHGDPIPTGAVARLGTERLRPGSEANELAFTGDGKLLASVHDDEYVELWDVRNGARRGRLSTPAGGRLRCLACSADGKRLAAGDANGHAVWVWELGTAKPPRKLPGHTSAPSTVAFSPDGKTLVSASSREDDGPR